MRRAGKILHYTKYKVYVVEAEEKILPENKIVDTRGRIVGEVIDVIGPINKPYLVVKPLIQKPEKLVGAEVYYIKRRRRGR